MNNHRYFLVHNDTNTAFELGIGDWEFVFKNGLENIDRNHLLRDLIVFSTFENLFVQPAYIIWLRDAIWDFVAEETTDLVKYDFSDRHPGELKIICSRFDVSGNKIIEHVNKLYL